MKSAIIAAVVAIVLTLENVATAAAILLFVSAGIVFLVVDYRLDSFSEVLDDQAERLTKLEQRVPEPPDTV